MTLETAIKSSCITQWANPSSYITTLLMIYGVFRYFNVLPFKLVCFVLTAGSTVGSGSIKYKHFFPVLILALCPKYTTAEPFQSIDSIESAVKKYLSAKISTEIDHKISIDAIDRRLHLHKCKKPLEVFSQKNRIKAGRLSMGIRCNDEKSWTMYNSAKIEIYKNIVVLKTTVRRGDIITRNHLALEKLEISNIRKGYLTEFSQALDKQITGYFPAGAVLTYKKLIVPKLIKRGQKIIISSKSKSYAVKMAGIAMMDGTIGERIRVKNEKSKRIIDATVVQAGLVSVGF